MSDEAITTTFVVLIVLAAFLVGGNLSGRATMREALDRGFAERCVGTTTIYFRGECPRAAE